MFDNTGSFCYFMNVGGTQVLENTAHKFKAAIKTNDEYEAIKKASWATLCVFLFLATIILFSLREGAPLPGPLSAMLIFFSIFALGFHVVCLVSLQSKKGNMDKLAKKPGWMNSQFLDDLNPHSVSSLNPTSLMELTPLDARSITSEKFIINSMHEKAVNQSLRGIEVSSYLKKIPVVKKLVMPAPKVKFKNVNPKAGAPKKKIPKVSR